MPDYTENRLIVRLRGFDARHYAKTRQYARQVERLYNTACDEIARAAGRITIPEDGVFSFDDFPATRRQAEGILSRLTKKVEAVYNYRDADGVASGLRQKRRFFRFHTSHVPANPGRSGEVPSPEPRSLTSLPTA